MDLSYLWIDPGTDLRISKEGAKLILYEQPSVAEARHRSEELDLYPDPSFAINGHCTWEIIDLLVIQSGGQDLAIGLAPNEHATFEGDF